MAGNGGGLVDNQMIKFLRIVFLPAAMAITVGVVAIVQWMTLIEGRDIAAKFHSSSRIVIFKDIGLQEHNGRSFPTYTYRENGEEEHFITLIAIDLPADGRVRLGPDPVDRVAGPYSTWRSTDVVVPLNGADSVESIYEELYERTLRADTVKASVISLCAVVAAIVGFYLQRKIIRALNHASRRY